MRTELATATRRAAQRPRTNQQGIALQTVIVIVVMLVIAGGVSGVLLSRGGDVISDLENTDTNAAQIDSKEKCKLAAEALVPGAKEEGTIGNLGPSEWNWNGCERSVVVAFCAH